jgi:hypothetical protein
MFIYKITRTNGSAFEQNLQQDIGQYNASIYALSSVQVARAISLKSVRCEGSNCALTLPDWHVDL